MNDQLTPPPHTEKQKMLAGQFYNSRDPELLEMYHRARALNAAFNAADSRDGERKRALLAELLGYLGEGVWIEAPFYCDYGELISIGAQTFLNVNCVLLDDNRITIGRNCLLGPGVHIYTAFHPLNARDRIQPGWTEGSGLAVYRTQTAPVTIGDNVWIGGNTVLMPGVSIGDNTTIGAGSLVTKDIPANVLALGSPCRVVRELGEGGEK